MLVSLVLFGCDSATAPEVLFGRNIDGIAVTLSASARVAEPGAAVLLTVAAHNRSDRYVQIGVLRGPALDAIIVRPNGDRASAFLEMVGDSVFTRELGEPHFAAPGETEMLELVWHAPATHGTYTLIGGLRGRGRDLHNPSAPVHIAVRSTPTGA